MSNPLDRLPDASNVDTQLQLLAKVLTADLPADAKAALAEWLLQLTESYAQMVDTCADLIRDRPYFSASRRRINLEKLAQVRADADAHIAAIKREFVGDGS